jgi:hypothetical protein
MFNSINSTLSFLEKIGKKEFNEYNLNFLNVYLTTTKNLLLSNLLFIKKNINKIFKCVCTSHSKKIFWTLCGGGGVFGLFLVQIYKKCSRGGGESKC